MPVTISRAPVDVERKDTGSGGRPPVYHRPTGGGGGGDENWDQGPEHHHPRELLTRYRMLLGFGLGGDLIFFVIMATIFFAQQHAGRISTEDQYMLDWTPLWIPPILWINTAILIVSAWTAEMARRHVFNETDAMEEWLGMGRPTSRHALPWLLATLGLGCLFLAGQVVAWRQLYAEGVYFGADPSSHFFYLVTGTHALHLAFGVAGLVAALVVLGSSSYRLEIRQIVVDTAAWYWHVMGILWICLFGLLLLAQ